MRIETVPLIIGILVALLGAGIIFDAWTPDEMVIPKERRRRPRVERHRGGEALIGFGVLALAATFVGRDTWRFSILVSIIGAGFLVLGTALNASYLRELYANRGPLRRRETRPEAVVAREQARRADAPPAAPSDESPAPSASPTPAPPPQRPERRAHPRG